MTKYDSGQPEFIVISMLEEMKKGKVLDLGCGEGRHALFLADKGFNVTAVDCDATELVKLEEQAERKGIHRNITLRHLDALEALEFNVEWDIVIVSLLMHHYSRSRASALITRAQMLTRPGGLNVIIAWTESNEFADTARITREDAFFPSKEELLERYRLWRKLLQGARRGDARLHPERPTTLPGMIYSGLFQKPH